MKEGRYKMKKKQVKSKGELELMSDKQVVGRGKTCTRILEISITPPARDAEKKHLPLNVSLVLDHSGSMQGDKLHFVKKAAAHVIDLLEEKDRAGVVIYDDQVKMIFSPANMTDESKQQAKTAIQAIACGGSTFLSGGWLKGCELVATGIGSTTINRTLLLTDGLANVGVVDIDELATQSRELFRRGVSTSCFGAGLGYDEHLLEAMANSGGGNFHFLETMNAIPLVFEREFKDLVDIALREVEISAQLPEGVTASVLAGWPIEVKNGLLKIFAGSLYSRRTQRFYLKLNFKKGIAGCEIVFSFTARGKDGGGDDHEAVEPIAFKLVPASEEASTPADQSLMERFAEVEMAEQANEALKRERAGDRAGSARMIRSSIADNQAYMPDAAKGKFEYLANMMSEGMDETSRKRHHREEYDLKRGRVAERDYELQLVDGHLFTRIEGQSVLLDTGIPVSLGKLPEFYFLNEVHALSQGYLGVTLETLEELVGAPIDVLLGTDILKKYYLTLDLQGNRVTFSSRPIFQPMHQVPMTTLIGAPIASFSVGGLEQQMFVDTGAKLSYVDQTIAANHSPLGKESDFYPGIGEFETDVFNIPFQLGPMQFQLRCGVLPKILETALFVTGKRGIVGSELYEKCMVCLAFPEQMIHLDRIR
jgi:Ca-activated chloride channel family protein